MITVNYKDEEEMKKKSWKPVMETLLNLVDVVCSDLCKYRETADEHGDCDYIREHGECPLERL